MIFNQVQAKAWLYYLLLAPLPYQAATQGTFPATVEIDLIFPRNDTYTPTTLTPLVFSVQNSHFALPLLPSIDLQLYRLGAADGPVSVDTGPIGLLELNSSSSDPYFAYTSTFALNATEGAWSLIWSVIAGNCSAASPGGHTALTFNSAGGNNFVEFTTKVGAKLPDLVAATSPKTCGSNQSSTFNVTGNLDVLDPSIYEGQNSCAILAPGPSPAANPCGSKINSAAASSISAAITARACSALQPIISCPPKTSAACSYGWQSTLGISTTFLIGVVVLALVYAT